MTNLKRNLICLISVIICSLLQMSILPLIFTGYTVPNLLLILTFSFGFLWGKKYGLAVGAVCGLLLDTIGGGVIGFNTLIYVWLGYLNGILSEKMETELMLSLMLLMTINELLYHVFVYVFGFIIRLNISLGDYVLQVFIPELIITVICMILIYGLLNYLNKRWNLMNYKGVKTIV